MFRFQVGIFYIPLNIMTCGGSIINPSNVNIITFCCPHSCCTEICLSFYQLKISTFTIWQ